MQQILFISIQLASYSSGPAAKTYTSGEKDGFYSNATTASFKTLNVLAHIILHSIFQMNHYRCKVGSVPVCRPDMDTSDATGQCATIDGTTESLLTNPGTAYTTWKDCKDQLYYGKACYAATQASDYYSLSTVYDHDGTPSCTGTNVIDVTTAADGWVKGAQGDVVSGTSKTWYDTEGTVRFVSTIYCVSKLYSVDRPRPLQN